MGGRIDAGHLGVAVVKLCGLQTGTSIAARRRELMVVNGSVRVYVVDYSSSLVAASGDELDRLVLALRSPLPGAVIVPQQLEPMFFEHSRRMFAHGITRRVFTDDRQALEWAVRRRAIG